MVDSSPCCFRIGYGSRLVPCCLEIISCEEYEEQLQQGPLLGGAIGTSDQCPKDAAAAGVIVAPPSTTPDPVISEGIFCV